MKNICIYQYIKESYILVFSSLPIISFQILQKIISFINSMLSNSIDITDISAVAIGTTILLPIIYFNNGLLSIITSKVVQLYNHKRYIDISYQLHQGLYLAAIMSILSVLILYNNHFFVNKINCIDSHIKNKVIVFLKNISWSIPGYLFSQILRCKFEGLSLTKQNTIINVISLIINIPISYICNQKKINILPLGIVRYSIANILVSWLTFLMLFFFAKKNNVLNNLLFYNKNYKINFYEIKKIFIKGLPLALSCFSEITFFTIINFLIIPLGIKSIISHQIVLNFNSLVSIFPMAISNIITKRVSNFYKNKKNEQIQISYQSGLILITIYTIITNILVFIFRKNIISIYNKNEAIITFSSHVIIYEIIYNIINSIQIINNGMLKGYKDYNFIYLMTFIYYWFIGLPIGYILSSTNYLCPAMGINGLWCGMIIGSFLTSISMIYRVFYLKNNLYTNNK